MKPLDTIIRPGEYLGLVGGYAVGKDYVARQLGATGDETATAIVHKVAAPLYALASILSGGRFQKADDGGRETLQRLGAWGRGTVDQALPWSAERLAASHYIRTMIPGHAWFGSGPNYWSDMFIAELRRAMAVRADVRHVCTDLRFSNEIEGSCGIGRVAFVTCRDSLLYLRREALGYAQTSADASEDIARRLQPVVSCGGTHPLHEYGIATVIWNDDPDRVPDFGSDIEVFYVG